MTPRLRTRKKARPYFPLWFFLSVALISTFFLLKGNKYRFLQGKIQEPDDPIEEGSFCEEPFSKNKIEEHDLSRFGVNELGEIMVIMYHDVRDFEAEWVRSKDNFKADLERFYELGYCLIPLNDYLNGNISVPIGKTPLVLTFDDGTPGQFKVIEDGHLGEKTVSPDCAVGILLEFSRLHPDFGHAATFFINSYDPFGDPKHMEENLQLIIQNGMEIGNHTLTHKDLTYTSKEEMAREIGGLANEIRGLLGYEPLSLALPYGGYPKSSDGLLSGVWDGQNYTNLGVLLVGAEPAPSPFSKNFRPQAIPRIRGSDEELDKWLGEMENYPQRKFVSDGDEDTVTVQESRLDDLNGLKVGERQIRTYSPENNCQGGD